MNSSSVKRSACDRVLVLAEELLVSDFAIFCFLMPVEDVFEKY